MAAHSSYSAAVSSDGVAEVSELFREAMSRLAAAVAVVTARDADGAPRGLVMTAFTSYSAEPPSVMCSIDCRSRSYEAITTCAAFGAHVLHEDQAGVAEVFAGKSDDKFAGLEWSWDADVPVLGGTMAYLRCRRSGVYPHGDHAVVIGVVEGGSLDDVNPMLYYKRSMAWRLAEPGA